MKFDTDFASIHAYLCADGYVIKNPENQKHHYYYIGFRNTNTVLLNDFQKKFSKVFGITPIITKDKDRCKVQNKELTLKLLKEFNSFYSKNWALPNISKTHIKSWLRSYFDSDGWVGLVHRKDRKIGLESINLKGLKQIQTALKSFDITSTIKWHKNHYIWSLTICGKDDIERFKKNIGFLHPKKSKKLDEALASYVNYNWDIPSDNENLIKFMSEKGKVSQSRKQVRFSSIIKENLIDLQNKLLKLKIESRLNGPWSNPYGSIWYCLSIKLDDYNKLRR